MTGTCDRSWATWCRSGAAVGFSLRLSRAHLTDHTTSWLLIPLYLSGNIGKQLCLPQRAVFPQVRKREKLWDATSEELPAPRRVQEIQEQPRSAHASPSQAKTLWSSFPELHSSETGNVM